ncbi:MAG: GatB/YqeY domain-containing protein [Methylococcales symbiont of Hymedesmia sp. n. MRB-2018]|nr:MAG: GatB/YqeY domain-containing protein [Methylococcales symbiont of Hymedesmia sp. n. MRB-2018]KAF3984457.1 MAG: GatB/YqeY domain-containing protein [Methylococcales symbiont of Hymedesmia sp. n. MRB-2018]
MNELKTHIKDEMKAAMRAKDKERLVVIRMILAAFKQIEVDERIELDNARMIVILDKMQKQRRESIKQFNDAGRTDLSEIEEAELLVIQNYLPKALAESEINALLEKAVLESDAESIKDMGKVMAILKPQMIGRADMSVVAKIIKARLAR